MTEDTFRQQLDTFMVRQPFKSFAIELNDGKRIEVNKPGSVAWGGPRAVYLGGPRLTITDFLVENVTGFTENDKPIIAMTAMEKRLRHRLRRLGKEALETLSDAVADAASDEEVDWADVESRVRDLHAELAIVADLVKNYRLETEDGAK